MPHVVAIDNATLVSTILAVAGGLWAVVMALVGGIWAVRTYRGQMNAQLFLSFTERYSEILRDAPAGFRDWCLDLSDALAVDDELVRASIVRYLNLCSEEWFLAKRGYLDRAIWEVWWSEMVRKMSTAAGSRAWDRVKANFDTFDGFAKQVDAICMLRHRPQAATPNPPLQPTGSAGG